MLRSVVSLLILWTIYPVAWALCDGGNVISPTGEMVFYGVLDLLAKPVFTLVHLFSLRKVDLSLLNLQSGKVGPSFPSDIRVILSPTLTL